MGLESYDIHIEDASPSWPVSFGQFQEVALQIMSDECKEDFPPNKYLFVTWLYLHFQPYMMCRAEEVWNQMKKDLKRKQALLLNTSNTIHNN